MNIWIPYTITNVAGLLLWYCASRSTRLARLFFFLLFGWACWFNLHTALNNPTLYLMYSNGSADLYSRFIEGWFSRHITATVSVIAIGQGAIATGMLLKGNWVRLACAGSIVFLLAIVPLGLNSAFPFSLTAAAASYLIWRNDPLTYLWKHKQPEHVQTI